MDHDPGAPIAYLVLADGTPVYSADGEQVGTVEHVLADAGVDIFDGLIVDTRSGRGGFRFADAEQVDALYERAVVLKLDREAVDALPEPSENAATMRVDPDDTAADTAGDKLRRAWDYLSGRY